MIQRAAVARKGVDMSEWIPFAEGKYLAERVFLIGAGDAGVEVEDTVIEVFEDRQGRRRLRGRGRVGNADMVRLLDEGEEVDVLLDLGGEFKYRLRHPAIQGGKVFAPGVKSFIQFFPQVPWEPLAEPDFNALAARVRTPNGGRG
jgi:hypothetical protein